MFGRAFDFRKLLEELIREETGRARNNNSNNSNSKAVGRMMEMGKEKEWRMTRRMRTRKMRGDC